MNGTIKKIQISSFNCEIYLPEKYNISHERYPIVYVNGEGDISEFMEKIEPHFNYDCQPFILLGIEPHNWNSDFTPWAAPALTKKTEAFEGEADNYLHKLIYEIKPFVDENYRTKEEPNDTALVGYSLAGLAAVYAMYKTSVFGKIASISTSMWYDGFIEFLEKSKPVSNETKVYMSLGKSEEKSRNQRMASVGDCTRRAFDILKSKLLVKENLILQWNEGGHFTDIPDRFEKAVVWLMR